MALREHAVPALVGAVFAAAIGGLVGTMLLTPSDGALEDAARELVPDGASSVRVGMNTGVPVIVGEFFVLVEFDREGGAELVQEAILAAGRVYGWQRDSIQQEPGGIVAELSRGSFSAHTVAYAKQPEGAIRVRVDRAAVTRGVGGIAAASAALGALSGVGLNRVTRRLPT